MARGKTLFPRPEREALAAVFKKARESVGMSQGELAKMLGKRQPYVWKVESGEQGVEFVEFLDWCAALKLDPATVVRLVVKN